MIIESSFKRKMIRITREKKYYFQKIQMMYLDL